MPLEMNNDEHLCITSHNNASNTNHKIASIYVKMRIWINLPFVYAVEEMKKNIS